MGRRSTPAVRRRWLRVRALLAGGLVLGVGAAVTLASWTDTEVGTGGFTASVFGIQGQGIGEGGYAEHPTAPGAPMTFTQPAAGLSPEALTYGWLNIRTTPSTTVAGTVALTAVGNSGGTLPPQLQYRAVTTPIGTTCNAGAFGAGAVYIAGNASTKLEVTAVRTPAVQTPIAAGGAAIRVCFEVQMKADAPSTVQGATGTVSWTFTAASVS